MVVEDPIETLTVSFPIAKKIGLPFALARPPSEDIFLLDEIGGED